MIDWLIDICHRWRHAPVTCGRRWHCGRRQLCRGDGWRRHPASLRISGVGEGDVGSSQCVGTSYRPGWHLLWSRLRQVHPSLLSISRVRLWRYQMRLIVTLKQMLSGRQAKEYLEWGYRIMIVRPDKYARKTSGYATMVHCRGCNPHRCTTTFANVEITSLMTS